MAVTVASKYSDVVAKVPQTSDLVVGQVSVNTADGIMHVKRPNGSVVELYTNKAPLVSPALTGTPTAPTMTPTSNSTNIATTAFVQGHVSSLSVLIAALEARIVLLENA